MYHTWILLTQTWKSMFFVSLFHIVYSAYKLEWRTYTIYMHSYSDYQTFGTFDMPIPTINKVVSLLILCFSDTYFVLALTAWTTTVLVQRELNSYVRLLRSVQASKFLSELMSFMSTVAGCTELEVLLLKWCGLWGNSATHQKRRYTMWTCP